MRRQRRSELERGRRSLLSLKSGHRSSVKPNWSTSFKGEHHSCFRPSRRHPSAAKFTSSELHEAVHWSEHNSTKPDTAGRIFISNIHRDVPVPKSVIKVNFEQTGRIRSHTIHCDAYGLFQGTAEVEFERKEDAIAAVRKYDNKLAYFGRTWQVQLISGSRPMSFRVHSGGVHKENCLGHGNLYNEWSNVGQRINEKDGRNDHNAVNRGPRRRNNKKLPLKERLGADLEVWDNVSRVSKETRSSPNCFNKKWDYRVNVEQRNNETDGDHDQRCVGKGSRRGNMMLLLKERLDADLDKYHNDARLGS